MTLTDDHGALADGRSMRDVALAPTPMRTLIELHRGAILAAVGHRRGRSIAVFGSVARGEETDASDIDFLVEFEPNSSLLDLIHLEDDLAIFSACPSTSCPLEHSSTTMTTSGVTRWCCEPIGQPTDRRHDLDEVDEIADIIGRGKVAFDSDIALRRAVERCLEILGEAAKAVTPAVTRAHPEIPWSDLAKVRDRLSPSLPPG